MLWWLEGMVIQFSPTEKAQATLQIAGALLLLVQQLSDRLEPGLCRLPFIDLGLLTAFIRPNNIWTPQWSSPASWCYKSQLPILPDHVGEASDRSTLRPLPLCVSRDLGTQ